MFAQIHYLIRSKTDGRYLLARLRGEEGEEMNYILVFKEDYEALSYLNTHAPDLVRQFGVESITGTQLRGILKRWGYQGIGVVDEPIEPRIQFLQQQQF